MTSDTALPVELLPYEIKKIVGALRRLNGPGDCDLADRIERTCALSATRTDLWEPIETAPKDRTPVIIAVPTKERDDHIVGEAYFDPEHDDGDWWWAGTGYGDYHGGPISDHHMPTHWQPLPAPPITTEGE